MRGQRLTSSTTRVSAGVLAVGVFLCAGPSTYALDCVVVCKDHTTQEVPAASLFLCHNACDTFCSGDENIQYCEYKGELIKGNPDCEALCKDGATQQTPARDTAACNDVCDDFCSTHGEVHSCSYRGDNVKGKCKVNCKDHTTNATVEASLLDCHDACDTFCSGPESVQYCEFKGVVVKGNPDCEALCKDGATQQTPAWDSAACNDLCDDFCLTHGDVHSCSFKGDNVKGKCKVNCKDHTTNATVEASLLDCHDACDAFCSGPESVQDCEFKGVVVKGNPDCEAICKDGATQQKPAWDSAACKTGCNDFCDPDHDGVLACYFKDDNIKGNCDVFCKDLTSDHIVLQNPTPEACHTECETFCGAPANVLACFLKGDNLKGGNCDVLCNNKEEDRSPQQDETACQDFCTDFCVTQQEDKVGVCTFKGVDVERTIPAVTEWGMVVMVLLVLAAGTVVIRRVRAGTVQA